MPKSDTTAQPPKRRHTDVVLARVGAQLVDLLLMGVQVLVLTSLLGGSRGAFGLAVLTLPLYGGLQEGLWNGQTVGKKVCDVRVVDEGGGECSLGQAFTRNLPAALIPGWLVYLVALLSMVASDRRQRVFDFLARTVVVKDRSR